MSFSIRFLSVPEQSFEGQREAGGELQLGSHSERFTASLDLWSRDDYQQQWLEALRSVAAGQSKAALMTNFQDPERCSHLEWWPLYREGDVVYIQNAILVYSEMLTEPFSQTRLHEYINERETVSEEGNRIPEWHVTLKEVREFLAKAETEWPLRRSFRGCRGQ